MNRSQSLDHRAGLFPGWLDQGGPSAAVRPALAPVGARPRRWSHPFAPSVIRGQLNQQTQPV